MKEAVIISTARTPIGIAFKGSLNNIKSPSMMGHAIRHAVERAGVDPGMIEDVVIGSVLTAGTAGMNVARLSALAAGLPNSVSGQTIDRQCSSGLIAIATAAKQIILDGQKVAVAGGQENISAVQNAYLKWASDEQDSNVIAQSKHAYMPMLNTAEYVAQVYGISREAQDEYAALSQKRTAYAQAAGAFDVEIAPITSIKRVINRETGEETLEKVNLSKDEGNRPDTSIKNTWPVEPSYRRRQHNCWKCKPAFRWSFSLCSYGTKNG